MATKRCRIEPVDSESDDEDETVTVHNDRGGKRARHTPTSETIVVLMTEYNNAVYSSNRPELVAAPSSLLSTVQGIRRLLLGLSKAEEEASLQKFLGLGLFHFVTHTLDTWGTTTTPARNDDNDNNATIHSIVYEALWILVDLSSRNAQYTHNVARSGAVTMPRLIKFLHAKQPANIREQTTWLLANLASDCDEFRRQVWTEPIIVQALCDNIRNANGNVSLVTTTVWAIGNVLHSSNGARTRPPHHLVLLFVPIVKAAYTCLATHREASVADLADPVMALWQIVQLGNEARQAVRDTGLVGTLISDIQRFCRKPYADKFVLLATRILGLFVKEASEEEARRIADSQSFLTFAGILLKSPSVRRTKVSAAHVPWSTTLPQPFSSFSHFQSRVSSLQSCRVCPTLPSTVQR
jgi:hypothetical protein